MAELADAPDLGSGARKGVGVQVPLLALFASLLPYYLFLKQLSGHCLKTVHHSRSGDVCALLPGAIKRE